MTLCCFCTVGVWLGSYAATHGFVQQEFFQKLMDLFRICEDLEDLDSLHIIYKIVKGISKLSPTIFFPLISSLPSLS